MYCIHLLHTVPPARNMTEKIEESMQRSPDPNSGFARDQLIMIVDSHAVSGSPTHAFDRPHLKRWGGSSRSIAHRVD
jgi:hypothetical protein